VSRGQSSSCVDIAFRMFGCGLPVPHGELVEWAVDALYLSVQTILQCDIDFFL
jgi:hypothetical protein